VATGGAAATSLALALAGPTTASGAWLAVVGLPDLGLLAAGELGVSLERTLLVADPGPKGWAGAVASLLDAVDVVLVRPRAAVATSAQRRLLARARDRGSVLIQAGGPTSAWAEAPELTVSATASHWEGLEDGHGRLRARRVLVAVSGRRGAARGRQADLWLPGPDGRIALATPVSSVPSVPSVSSAGGIRSGAPVEAEVASLREVG
jgi:hypothetical protein